MPDDQIVPFESIRDDSRLPFSVPSQDLRGGTGVGIQATIRPKRLAIAPLRICQEFCYFAVESQLVRLAGSDIVVEDFTLGIDGRAFGELVAFTHQLPVFARNQDFLNLGRALSRTDRFWPVLPEPPHGIREQFCRVLVAVSPFAPVMVYFVSRKRQRSFHRQVGNPPITTVNILVFAAIFQIDSQRLRLVFSNDGRVVMATSQTDVGSDRAEDTTKRVGPLPGHSKCTNRSTARTSNGTIVAIF